MYEHRSSYHLVIVARRRSVRFNDYDVQDCPMHMYGCSKKDRKR